MKKFAAILLLLSVSAQAHAFQVGDLVFAYSDSAGDLDSEREFNEGKVCTIIRLTADEAGIACREATVASACAERSFTRPLRSLEPAGPVLSAIFGVQRGSLVLDRPPYVADGFLMSPYPDAADMYWARIKDAQGCWHWGRGPDVLPVKTASFPAKGPQLGDAVWILPEGNSWGEILPGPITRSKIVGYVEVHEFPRDGVPPVSEPLDSFPKIPGPIYLTENGRSHRLEHVFYWESAELENRLRIHPGDHAVKEDTDEIVPVSRVLWNGCDRYDEVGTPACEPGNHEGYRPLLVSAQGQPFVGAFRNLKEVFPQLWSNTLPFEAGNVVDGNIVRPGPGADPISAISDETPFFSEPYRDKLDELAQGLSRPSFALTSGLRRYLVFTCDGVEQQGGFHPRVKELCKPKMPNGPVPRSMFAIEL